MHWDGNKIILSPGNLAILNSPLLRKELVLEDLFAGHSTKYPPICHVAVLVLLRCYCPTTPIFWQNYRELLELTNATEKHYERIEISHGAKMREVFSPDWELRYYQEWIQEYILYSAELPECATAYRKGKNVRANAAPHVGEKTVVKLDIRHFFDSITEPMVYRTFEVLTGYPKPVLTVLTRLCCLKGRLPQGACTSPTLSNLIMREFDLWAMEYCAAHDLSYTRYSDDMTFSGDSVDAKALIGEVRKRLRQSGFTLNTDKTKVLGPGACHRVTGLVCNEKIAVPASYRKKIRQEMHYLYMYGVNDHLRHMNDPRFVSADGTPLPEHYLYNLKGRINYVLSVERENWEFQRYKFRIEDELTRYIDWCVKCYSWKMERRK